MNRSIAFLGAASNIGARPYDDGVARHLNRSAEIFRERGLVERVRATDVGDVRSPRYRDYIRPPDRARNEADVLSYSRRLAERVAIAGANRRFVFVAGGDCSVALGCTLGAARAAGGPVGLAYFDAHADFATPDESTTGSVASMALALVSGRGDSPLARLGGEAPLVDPRHIALIGRRAMDSAPHAASHPALSATAILDVPDTDVLTQQPSAIAETVLTRIASDEVRGFWIHVDADVLNPLAMRAVEAPEPGGPLPNELVELLGPLVRHPRAVGLSLAVYDPALDPDRAGARELTRLVTTLFRS